ncbi:hypothetical protein GCM10010497_59130 [Streptomyces cinereoruber]|uniref:Uncharacterized protein n=1 Tax=Streptomyces cinereoruber TaxID=67260 RepID=A0AAV4KTV5_9ACTN|nr:hypothetical protein GCM10010497_59130 [Streptomyces cinereoruber]
MDDLYADYDSGRTTALAGLSYYSQTLTEGKRRPYWRQAPECRAQEGLFVRYRARSLARV